MTWAPDYATADELLAYLKVDDDADQVRTFAQLWVTAVSRNIDEFCGRQFGAVAAVEERYFTPVWDRRDQCWYATIDDLQSTAGMSVVDEDGATVTDYVLLPRNAPQRGRPYEVMKLSGATGEIAPTALWGWTATPSAVKVGLFLQGARLAARRDSPFGVAGSPSEGSELRLLAQLDPDFRTTLAPLRRKWWAA